MGLFHHALVYMGDLQFDKGTISKFNDVLLEHGGLPHVLPLAVHLKLLAGQVEGTILTHSLPLSFFCGIPPSCLKVIRWWVGDL